MLAFTRPALPRRTNIASQNPVLYQSDGSKVQFHPPSARPQRYIMTHTLPPTDPKGGPSILQPPFHLHLYQIEHFRLVSGQANFYLGLSPKPYKTLSQAAGSETEITIPKRRYHRFENASASQDLVVDIQLDPENYEGEQRFFRNFFGYLGDCKSAGTEPSLFQLMVFLCDADTPVAVPLPSILGGETVGFWVSWLLMLVLAAWGRYVLGYKGSYPEYYEGAKVK